MSKHEGTRIGWIGTGRMGAALAKRLLDAGHDVALYNRTRSKAEALGATVVDSPADLADRDIVFTMVGGSDDFKEVVIGPNGVLSMPDVAPRMLIDSTTISQAASDEVRARVPGQPFGHSPFGRHNIDVGVAFVSAGERNQGAVG